MRQRQFHERCITAKSLCKQLRPSAIRAWKCQVTARAGGNRPRASTMSRRLPEATVLVDLIEALTGRYRSRPYFSPPCSPGTAECKEIAG